MDISIVEVPSAARDGALVAGLFAVWEASVRATHDFLPAGEVERIGAMVPEAIAGVPTLLVAYAGGEPAGAGALAAAEPARGPAELPSGCEPVGFLGLDGAFIEMLFIAPGRRGGGIGRALVEFARDRYGADEVSVNEQNPQAVGFYEHMGFRAYRRTATDAEGGPYPLLYMRREA